MVSVTAFGRVPPGKMVHRSGAKAGERVMVTGTIGDAALGLAILRGGKVHAAASDKAAREALIGRYRVPQPRVAMAEIVRDHASAAMDVSDGLAGDLDQAVRRVRRIRGDRSGVDPAVRRGEGSGVARHRRTGDADRRRRRLRDPVHDTGGSRRGVRASRAGCRRRREFHRNGGRGKRGSEVHRRAGQGNRAGTAALTAIFEGGCVNAVGLYFPPAIAISRKTYRCIAIRLPSCLFERAPKGLLPETSSRTDLNPCDRRAELKAYVLWRRENGYGNSEVVQRSKGFRFH